MSNETSVRVVPVDEDDVHTIAEGTIDYHGRRMKYGHYVLAAAPTSCATGWAVFGPDGKVIVDAIGSTPDLAWNEYFCGHTYFRSDLIKASSEGYTCAEVVITRKEKP